MNTETNQCDRGRIDRFLDSDQYRLDDNWLLQHLDTCSACRDYLESHAADQECWTNAAKMLKSGQFDGASSAEYSIATMETRLVDSPTAIEGVLNLLTPSEDPGRLGRLGTYEITGVIGAGGMGVVLKAIDPSLDRVVAIKVLAPHLAHSGSARKRFSREAKAAAAVLHPNVIPIHSVSSDDKIPFLVMAYIRGGSLQKRLNREGPLSTLEILRIGSQVAAGLAAAHEQGLVHRDVKPENSLLEEGVERITLTDFGLARAVDDASVTQPGMIAGTPQYMSPEQACGELIDQRSDLFSLGCVLYALCTGRPPFRADSSYAVMRKITDDSPMPIRELNPDIPEWLCSIIAKLMEKKKADRFRSAQEVHQLLERCLSHAQQPTVTKLPEIPRPGKTIRRFTPITIILGLFMMTTIIAIVLFGLNFFLNPPTDGAKDGGSAGASMVDESRLQMEERLKSLVQDHSTVVRAKIGEGMSTGAANAHLIEVRQVLKGENFNEKVVLSRIRRDHQTPPALGDQPLSVMPELKPGEYVLILQAVQVASSFESTDLFGFKTESRPTFNYFVVRDGERHAAWPVDSKEARFIEGFLVRGQDQSGAGQNVLLPWGAPEQLRDGEYTFLITRTANHPNVQFPTDSIPDSAYEESSEAASQVQFSDNLKSIKLMGFGGIGELESRVEDTLVYSLIRGLDGSGSLPAQMIVNQTETGITATLTQFGSGVPVIVSHKGTLAEVPRVVPGAVPRVPSAMQRTGPEGNTGEKVNDEVLLKGR